MVHTRRAVVVFWVSVRFIAAIIVQPIGWLGYVIE
jgi:hypothetical protein